MPSPEQLTALGRLLEFRAAELALEVAAARAPRDDDTGREVTDLKEVADDQAQAVLDDAQVERDLAELHEIRLARQRLADGSFGLCIDCGGEIALPRLLAQPAASRCLACQDRAERLT